MAHPGNAVSKVRHHNPQIPDSSLGLPSIPYLFRFFKVKIENANINLKLFLYNVSDGKPFS